MKLDHVGLTVGDLDAMTDWYAKALALEVEFACSPLFELSDHEAWAKALKLAPVGFGMGGGPFVGLDRLAEFFFNVWAKDLDRDLTAFGRHGAMDLRYRCGTNGRFVEVRIEALQRCAEALFDRLLDQVKGSRREVVLQLR